NLIHLPPRRPIAICSRQPRRHMHPHAHAELDRHPDRRAAYAAAAAVATAPRMCSTGIVRDVTETWLMVCSHAPHFGDALIAELAEEGRRPVVFKQRPGLARPQTERPAAARRARRGGCRSHIARRFAPCCRLPSPCSRARKIDSFGPFSS